MFSYPTLSHSVQTSKVCQVLPLSEKNLAPSEFNKKLDLAGILAWKEQNQALYLAIVGGRSELPESDQAQFMDWWNWANTQGGQSVNWGENDLLSDGATEVPSIPAGAKPGPFGNAVFNSATAETNYIPSSLPVDVLSDEFTLNIDVKVRDVQVDKTVDTRLNPPVEVIRITVNDPFSRPSCTVYFVQSEADININLIGGKGAELHGELPNVKIGSYSSPDSESAVTAQSSLSGTPVEGEADALYYEVGSVDQTIDCHPSPGKNETHYLVGNAKISLPVSTTANAENSDNPAYDYKITATHKDGSTDSYYVKKPFMTSINGVKGYVRFNGQAPKHEAVPAEFADTISLNVGTSDAAANPEDTTPDDVIKGALPGAGPHLQDPKHPAQKAVYNTSETVSLHANHDDSIRHHEIYAPDVVINVDNYQDEVSVVAQAEGYLVTVGGASGVEYFWVDGGVSSLTINGTKVDVSAVAGDPKVILAGQETGGSAQSDVNQILENYLGIAGGKSEAQLLSALNSNGFNFPDISALSTAIGNHSFPPAYGTSEFYSLIKSMYALDPVFSGAVNSATAWQSTSLNMNYKNATQRLVQLLSALYPDHNISATSPNCSDAEWRHANDISFDGVAFSITKETKGHTSELAW